MYFLSNLERARSYKTDVDIKNEKLKQQDIKNIESIKFDLVLFATSSIGNGGFEELELSNPPFPVLLPKPTKITQKTKITSYFEVMILVLLPTNSLKMHEELYFLVQWQKWSLK